MTEPKIGQMITPVPLWNRTAGRGARLGTSVKIIDVRSARSESGWMLTVYSTEGRTMELDSHWFEEFQDVRRTA